MRLNRSPTISVDPQISIFNASATVDVWRASLARPAVEQQELARCLAPDEERRAARFRAQRDRIRFSAARGLLRHILARYVGVAPARIVFGYEALGKPLLPDHPEVSFNLSHSGDVLVVAITHGRRVGVDVEAGLGLGGRLMREALRRARELGHSAVLLVGDAPYYERFGFSREATDANNRPLLQVTYQP